MCETGRGIESLELATYRKKKKKKKQQQYSTNR
jgi:hypothetical protein